MINQKPFLGTLLNTTHPLSDRLRVSYVLNEGTGGTIFNLANNFPLRPSITGTPSWEKGGLSLDGSTNYIILETNGGKLELGDYTIVALGEFPTPGAVSAVVSRMDPVASTTNVDYHLTVLTDRKLRNFSKTASVSTTIDSTDSYTADTPGTMLAWLRKGLTGTFAINGKYDSGGWQAVKNPTDSTERTVIGANGSTVTQLLTANLQAVYIFDRVLTEVELASLHADPYQMFEQDEIPLYISGAPPVASDIPVFSYYYNQART